MHAYKINGYIIMLYNNDIYIATVHGKIQQPKTKCPVLDDNLSVCVVLMGVPVARTEKRI